MPLSPKQLFINRAVRILGHSTLIESGADELFLMCLRDMEAEIEKTRALLRPHYFIDQDGFGDDDL